MKLTSYRRGPEHTGTIAAGAAAVAANTAGALHRPITTAVEAGTPRRTMGAAAAAAGTINVEVTEETAVGMAAAAAAGLVVIAGVGIAEAGAAAAATTTAAAAAAAGSIAPLHCSIIIV